MTASMHSKPRSAVGSVEGGLGAIGERPSSVSSSQSPADETNRQAEADQKAELERHRLLSAAMEVLQRSGWWGFKVEGVLRQAGLSTRSFYRHFDKKSDLLLALLEQELGAAAIKLGRVTAAADTPSDRIRAFVSATIDMAYHADLAKPSSLFASHWRELLPEYPEAIDRCTERMVAPLVDAISEGKAQGEFTSDDPEADARAIFYLVAGMTADQASRGASIPREDFEHIVMPFIGRAIGLS
ncbi:TetR/AcrR family transcriptional regulator [Mycolicibacterium stellerae]|uniref:TetR/AcrR family transcriptional regulator n=1 Tax=Mycolicibacterium stellerae TaxID=2358193 RepID=UPI001F3A6D36|nr:TetR family transcriptional regulator [Mycolicibacterium stellerae]